MAHRRRRPHHLLEGSATPSEATLQPEEVGAPEEEIGLAQPARAVSELRQIHSALLPEPHDLDPYVPIGIRIGSFLLFPELESRRRYDQQRFGHALRYPFRHWTGG